MSKCERLISFKQINRVLKKQSDESNSQAAFLLDIPADRGYKEEFF